LSMLHVDDLTRAIVAWLGAWQHCLQQTYAIDDGKSGGYDWADIGEAVSKGKYRLLQVPPWLLGFSARINLLSANIFGYAPMLTPGKVQELIQPDWLCADNGAFTAATAWEPDFDLKRGVQQLVEQGLV